MNIMSFTDIDNKIEKLVEETFDEYENFNSKYNFTKLPTCNKKCENDYDYGISHSFNCIDNYKNFKKNIIINPQFKTQLKITKKRFNEDPDFYQYIYRQLPTCYKNCIKEDENNLTIHTKECLEKCKENIQELIDKPFNKFDNPNTTTGPYTLWTICTHDCYHHLFSNGCPCKNNLKSKLNMVEKLLDGSL